MKAYIAAPFFNQEQNELLDEILTETKAVGINVYSPRDECLYDPETGMEGAEKIVEDNIDAIKSCDVLIGIMNGKDVGTLMEIGVAHALGKQIGLIWNKPPEGMKFNLMLAAMAEFTCTSVQEYCELMDLAAEDGQLPFNRYQFEGEME